MAKVKTRIISCRPGAGPVNPVTMIGYLTKAFAQLTDPKLRGVLWFGILGALAVFAALWTATWWLLSTVDPSSIWGLGWLIETLGEAFGWIAGLAYFGAMLAATFLMFPAVVTILVGLLLEKVVDAVEARHYPELGEARKQGLGEILGTTVKFALTLILLNLLVLPLYLVLIFIPGANLVLYYLLNGYLIGREYFELVAFRRLMPGEAIQLRRENRTRVLIAGVVLTFLMTIPVVNLIAPVLGVAFIAHLAHDLIRRRPAVADHSANHPAIK